MSFTCDYDRNGVPYDHNAVPEDEYEHRGRKIVPTSISAQVKSQVFNQIGQRNGTMTFKSLLTKARPDKTGE